MLYTIVLNNSNATLFLANTLNLTVHGSLLAGAREAPKQRPARGRQSPGSEHQKVQQVEEQREAEDRTWWWWVPVLKVGRQMGRQAEPKGVPGEEVVDTSWILGDG